MILGLDFYDTITAWPVELRKLATDVIAGGGTVHIVTAIKEKNREETLRHIKDARIPYTNLHFVYFTNFHDIPNLKVPVYKDLQCDLIVEDNSFVVALARLKGLCAVEISGFSNSPLTVHGR